MPSAFDKQFGEELRRARQDHGMTQRGLAAKMQLLGADISENRIGKIERGVCKITPFELVKIAGILNIDLNARAAAYCAAQSNYRNLERSYSTL